MRETILIVDDEREVANLLASVLRHRGFDASAVDSMEACLDRLRRERIDVVVTDIDMPGGSGLELCRVLHEKYPFVVLLVLTGHARSDVFVAAREAGACGFIQKPVTVEMLDSIVVHALADRELAGTG